MNGAMLDIYKRKYEDLMQGLDFDTAEVDQDDIRISRMHVPPHRTVDYEGHQVEKVTVDLLKDGRVSLVLDGRIGHEPVSMDEFNRWLPMVANALAIGAGHPCHWAWKIALKAEIAAMPPRSDMPR